MGTTPQSDWRTIDNLFAGASLRFAANNLAELMSALSCFKNYFSYQEGTEKKLALLFLLRAA